MLLHYFRINFAILTLFAFSTSMKLDKIDLLGYVSDGEATAHALCRITMEINGYTFPVFGCYRVRQGEPAWDHLNDQNRSKLVDALREKWTP